MSRGRNYVDVQEPLPGIYSGKLCRVHVTPKGRYGWVLCVKCPAKLHILKPTASTVRDSDSAVA